MTLVASLAKKVISLEEELELVQKRNQSLEVDLMRLLHCKMGLVENLERALKVIDIQRSMLEIEKE